MNARALVLALALALPQAAGAQAPPPAAPSEPPPPPSFNPVIPPPVDRVFPPLASRPLAWQIVPRIALTETWSDNPLHLDDAAARSGWITTVAPAVGVDHRGAFLRVSADYRHVRDFRSGDAGERGGDTARNYLRSLVTYDLVEKRFWLEGRASITQERRSVFDSGVVDDSPAVNTNRVETRLYSFGPVVQGTLGDLAQYQTRFNTSSLRAEGAARVDTSELVGTIRNAAPARFGWSADAAALRTRSDSFGTLDDRRIRASFIYSPLPQVHLSLSEGYEETDFAPEGDRRRSTPGVGLEWSPGPRTQFAAVAERRFFGTGHLVNLRHRTALTAWELRSRRESTYLSRVLTNASTLEDLMSELLTSSIPDPWARAEAARRRLAQFGANPSTLGSGFLTERPYLIHGVDANVVFTGVRNIIAFGGHRTTTTALLGATLTGDSFAETEAIRQRGFNGAWSLRLTPLTTVTFSAARLRSAGESGGLSSSTEHETVILNTQLSPRLTASLGLRRIDFESTRATSYEEKSIFGTVSFRMY